MEKESIYKILSDKTNRYMTSSNGKDREALYLIMKYNAEYRRLYPFAMDLYVRTQEFNELVRDMRTKQKQYFATRNKGALIRSKVLEKKVDEYLNQQPATSNQ